MEKVWHKLWASIKDNMGGNIWRMSRCDSIVGRDKNYLLGELVDND